MHEHLAQARHNQKFHDRISDSFADEFYDWRITCLFYVALHYLHALASKRDINIGVTHQEVARNVNPFSKTASMQISKGAWNYYYNLYSTSKTARYHGISDPATFQQIMKKDYEMCLESIEGFKKYILKQGVDLEG